jgi:RNA polymerase sigma-70 factor (ECF subfamily)
MVNDGAAAAVPPDVAGRLAANCHAVLQIADLPRPPAAAPAGADPENRPFLAVAIAHVDRHAVCNPHSRPDTRPVSIHSFRFRGLRGLAEEIPAMVTTFHPPRHEAPDDRTPAAATPEGNTPDEELFRRFRSTRDPAAFESLVHRFERELYGYLRRYLHDAQLAEDVFQATFLRVHQKADRFEPGRRFRPWLYAVATHQAIDARRRDRRHRLAALDAPRGRDGDSAALVDTLPAAGDRAGDRLEDEESCRWVRAAVAGLPPAQRDAVALVYGRGLKYRQVAEALGIPIGTVKSRLHAALTALRVAGRRPMASPACS